MDVFHGNWRAPKASRPIITVVATEDAMKQLLAAFGISSLDFAIGEPGRIRDLGVNAPILMMSGGGDAQKAEALIAGAVGYLHKHSIYATWTIPSLSLSPLARPVVESSAPTRGPARAEEEVNDPHRAGVCTVWTVAGLSRLG